MSLGSPINTPTLSNMDSRIKETLDAWLKFGTAYLVYRLGTYYFIEDESTTLFDAETLQIILYIIVGFTIYYMIVKPYIPVGFEHPVLRDIANDTLMFGTVLISSHILDVLLSGGDFMNSEWLKSSGIILVSFAAYQIFIHPFVPTEKLSPKAKPIVDDWLKFGTFLLVARLLQGREIDQNWLYSVFFVLLGFTCYHLITKKLIN
jgi:hypothetical protein